MSGGSAKHDSAPDVEALWRQFSGDLRGFIRRRVSDDATADDLLQDVFVRIHERLHTVNDDGRIGAWVHQIARNRIVDHYRARRPVDARDSLEPAAPDAPDASAASAGHNAAIGAWLMAMIEQLPDGYRDAIRLVEVEGLTQTAAAERLGLSVSGTKSRVQRGRARLREMLHRCCIVERDRRGNVLDYQSRHDCC